VTELFLIAFIGALLVFHFRSSERWEAERARLLAALTAPTPVAAHAALTLTTQPAKDAEGEPVRLRRVPIGEG
jgi:hypothetical protein